MIVRGMFAAVIAAAFAAAPAAAQPLIKQYKAKEVVTIAPDQAYILYRSPERYDVRLLRTPDEADTAAYKAERAAALAKAKEKYVKAQARYESEMKVYRQSKEVGQQAARPKRPVEPTDQNLDFPAIESSNFLNVLGGRVLTRDGDNIYLIAVPPGIYSVYGQFAIGMNGPVGLCMCMGSVRFEAAAGTITDVGEINLDAMSPSQESMVSQTVTPAGDAMALPPQVKGLPLVRADLRAAGKMPNFFGVLIERLEPIKGVLAYQRDKVIDVKSGKPVD
jgi:hypothetical protein